MDRHKIASAAQGIVALLLMFAAAQSSSHAAPAAKAARKVAQHAAPSTFMFIAYGDTRSDPVAHQSIVNYIVSLKPEFVLQSGDLVDHGTDKEEWAQFDQITAPLRSARIDYYPARGNHDIGPYYIRYAPKRYVSGNGYYYSIMRDGIKFIAIDSFEPFDADSAQYRWLEAQLKSTHKGETVIPFMHESPFSVGPHGDNLDVQKWLHPLFVKYHVPLVFAGHDHLYYRTVRDGVTYVVTGGGGAPLYVATNSQNAIPGDVYKTSHHVIRCDVTPATVTLTALTPDGVVIDKLTVKR